MDPHKENLNQPAEVASAPPGPPAKPARARPNWLAPWPIYLLTVLVVAGTIYVTRARQQAGLADPVLPKAISLEQNIEVKFSDVTMQGRQKGVQRWLIEAPTVSLSRDGRYTTFEPKPKGRFLNLKDWKNQDASPSEKVRALDWTADQARFDSFSEDLHMSGHVVLTTDDKDIIKTEELAYRARTKRVEMPKPVTITMTDGTEARGDALEANADAEVFELKGHVDFRAKAQDEERL
ncbi:MAG: LPS export ABC transporter periplasmic protein LptC [Candidatus Sericytochromatia bacterium]|nr:LPS export ABC transporter periplasmic protein LptC [Candidatus Sericytochromatia bacterium]